nr:hypothetical protein [Klebsiella pneumoniae]
MFAGKKSAQIREILISESAWEEMTCLFAPSLAFEYIHRKNKFNIFIQIPFFVPSLATPLRRCLECKALFQMKQMGINRLRSKIGSSAKWGFHQHILLIHLVSQKRFFHARG